jgi:hypothetical protein
MNLFLFPNRRLSRFRGLLPERLVRAPIALYRNATAATLGAVVVVSNGGGKSRATQLAMTEMTDKPDKPGNMFGR